jgi:hypothetical protein
MRIRFDLSRTRAASQCLCISGPPPRRYALFRIFSTPCGRERQGWTMMQFDFTVRVRGSISNVDRTEPLSFMSTLKALGNTSQINLEKIKVVAKHTFEAHDLMLRSYYAVKFSSSSQVEF